MIRRRGRWRLDHGISKKHRLRSFVKFTHCAAQPLLRRQSFVLRNGVDACPRQAADIRNFRR
jgi:hypothetical protein